MSRVRSQDPAVMRAQERLNCNGQEYAATVALWREEAVHSNTLGVAARRDARAFAEHLNPHEQERYLCLARAVLRAAFAVYAVPGDCWKDI